MTAHTVLTCPDLVELITDYLEGALPAADRARFEEHLARCQGCTRYVEQMQLAIRLTGRLTEDQIAPEARQELLDLFQDWKKR
jgi:anti-sigma factor RsiW